MIWLLGLTWLFSQLLGLVTLGRRWDERRQRNHEHEAWMIDQSASGGYYCRACGARTPTHPDAYPTRVGLALDRAEDGCQSAHRGQS